VVYNEDNSTQNSEDKFQHLSFATATILLVEDMESNRKIVNYYLENFDLKITEAVNGEEAVKIANNLRPDLIIMDIQMPIMDGYEATKIIKSNAATAKIPVVALTASVMPEQIQHVMKVCDDFLRKPVTKIELLEKLVKYLPHTFTDTNRAQSLQPADLIENIRKYYDSLQQLPEGLSDALFGQLQTTFKEVMKTLAVNKIKVFATEFIAISEKYEIAPFVLYGKELLQYSTTFRFDKLLKTLNFFPEILKIFEVEK